MAINDMVGRVLRPLGLVAVVYGCGGGEESPQGCNTDKDCEGDRVCDYDSNLRYMRCVGGSGDEPNAKEYCTAYVEQCNTKTRTYDLQDCIDTCSKLGLDSGWCLAAYCSVQVGECRDEGGLVTPAIQDCMDQH